MAMPGVSTPRFREQCTELAFEEHAVKALALVNSGVLALMAAGTGQGIAVVVGSGVSVVPAYEFCPIRYAVRSSDLIGCALIDSLLPHALQYNPPIDHVELPKDGAALAQRHRCDARVWSAADAGHGRRASRLQCCRDSAASEAAARADARMGNRSGAFDVECAGYGAASD